MPLQPLQAVINPEASFWQHLGHGAVGGLLIGAVLGTAVMAIAMVAGGIPVDLGEVLAGTTAMAFGGIFFGAFVRLVLAGDMRN